MKFIKFISLLLISVMLFSIVATSSVSFANDSLPFTDVAKDWAYEPIKFVYENGLMNGTGGTAFSPKAPLTRAMVVTVLYRLAGSPTTIYVDGLFLDIERGTFYSDAAIWGLKNEVVSGTSTDEWGTPYFSPDRNITRQELATLFVRFAKYQKVILSEGGNINSFTDADKVAAWAEDAMKWATEAGLINGTSDGKTLSPTGEATREQFAAIIQRYCTAEFEHEVFYAEPDNGNSYTKPVYELCDNADIYVAVDGSDKNPGTIEKPLATFEGARNAVRELKKTAKKEIVVAFMAGEYDAPVNLTFTQDDTGSESVPITYRAYGDGDVIFNSGLTVTSNEFSRISEDEAKLFPKKAVSQIKKIDLSDKLPSEITHYNRLFNEKYGPCHLARNINKSGFKDMYMSNQTTEGEFRTCIKASIGLAKTLSSLDSLDGLWIKGQLCTGYTFDIFKVLRFDPETSLIYLDTENYHGLLDNHYQPHVNFPGFRMPEGGIFLYNHPSFLDDFGEYWIDETTSTLYVYEPLETYTYSIGKNILTFEKGVDHINLIGLSFKGTAVDTMINVNGDYFTFDGCSFSSFTGIYGIYASEVNNFTFENCDIYNFPGHGLGLLSDADRNNIISANNVIRNNFVHDYGSSEYWSDGIEIANDVGTLIEHNEFKNAVHGGLSYYECIDLIIQYNIFDNLMHSSTDYGAIYTHRGCAYRDNIIRYNLFKNMELTMSHAFYNDGGYGQITYGNLLYDACGDNICINDGRDNVMNDNISIYVDGLAADYNVMFNYFPGPYDVFQKPDKQGDIDGLIGHMNNRVMPGEEGYDKWLSRWPIMYEYNYDKASAGDFNSFYSTINYVSRNKSFHKGNNSTSKLSLGQYGDMFAIAEDNVAYPLNVNPYFKNPAVGDYTIVNNTEDFKNIYDFSKFGIIN